MDQKPLHDHIESFHQLSLLQGARPSHINVKLMHADYIENDNNWSNWVLSKGCKVKKYYLYGTWRGGVWDVYCRNSMWRLITRDCCIPRNLCISWEKSNKKNTICVVWHKGIAGQSATERAGTLTTLSTGLTIVVPRIKTVFFPCPCVLSQFNTISTEDITLEFFEPGHTLMSADSWHQQDIKCRPGGVERGADVSLRSLISPLWDPRQWFDVTLVNETLDAFKSIQNNKYAFLYNIQKISVASKKITHLHPTQAHPTL